LDSLLTLSVLLLGFVPQAGTQLNLLHATPLYVVTTVAQAVPLVWRRKAPTVVFGVVLAACIVQWAGAESSSSNISFMICLHAITRYRSRQTLRVAVGVLVPCLLVLTLRVPHPHGQAFLSLLFLLAAIVATIALALVAEERKAQLTRLAERASHAEFEREQRARMAVLAERARFSREMHDILGHTLAVITGLADGGVRQVETHPERGRQVFELIGDTSRQALADLRRTLGALRERPIEEGGESDEGAEDDALAPQPGISDIAQLLDRTRSAGPHVSYRVSGEVEPLARSLQLAIYRIVQESLTNSLKHAGPDTGVEVAIESGGELVRLSVSDTGPDAPRAFFPAGAGPGGQGLTGVRERAALAGGRAEAGPNRAGGWTVTARFPLDPSEEA
jgi:signal transduction histidine kinase